MRKLKIAWITGDYFIDVDLPIIKKLGSFYDVKWLIVISHNSTVEYEEFVNRYLGDTKVGLNFLYLKNRSISPKTLADYCKIINQAKKFHPDFYYLSFLGMPFALFLYMTLLPIKKCVIPCHNVTTPKGAKNESFARIYTHLWLSVFKNIQVFSKGQHKKLTEKFNGKNLLYAPLAIKDYGDPKVKTDKDSIPQIRFLFFGNIVEYKRVDILIKATEILTQEGFNFKVRIAGACSNWDKYQKLIKHPGVFELNIKRIPNEDVADLFADSHYFVMPYQDIAQSGAITVAFRYNLPVICSDIEQFKEFVVDNKTGYIFKKGDARSLSEKMKWLICNHKETYSAVCKNEQEFVSENFSLDTIIDEYRRYFESL